MRTHRRSIARAEGFTLIEVIAAMFVLLIGVLGALALIDRANATTVSTRTREAAINTARELIEAARSVPYQRITPAAFEAEVQTLPGLDDEGTAPGWTIKRRGTTFSVVATVCTFDDARDGGGSHAAGGFCVDSAATSATPDRNPEDYRRVRVEVRWNDRGGERVVHQTELINNPGSAGAPAVRTLNIRAGSATIAAGTGHVTAADPSTHELTFDLTTSSPPATLHWLLDGTGQEEITVGGGLAWSFKWPLGAPGAAGSVVDGTYVVGAEAFDAYDVAGPARSHTVLINRLLPEAVAGVVGGRNGDPARPADQVVDLEWLPNSERDIIGYSVDRIDALGNRTEVCERKQRIACVDADPPVEDGLRYLVHAWDTNAVDGQPRKSVNASAPLVVNMGNNPPVAPASVIATLQPDGTVKLAWPRPAPVEDPDPGDSIAFYRIYRDGTGFDQRYTTWENPDALVEFVDGNTEGLPHEYWVTSVDTGFAESAPVKAVTP
jgi:prepilin-type N-terminal cleavage/methylation domain-containing protein